MGRFRIDNLDAQPFRGNIHQQLVPELAHGRVETLSAVPAGSSNPRAELIERSSSACAALRLRGFVSAFRNRIF